MELFSGGARFVRTSVVLVAAVVLSVAAGSPAGANTGAEGATSPSNAAEGCRRLSLATPFSVGKGSCQGVRPGAAIRTRIGGCTMSFLFRGNDGRRYIGTAGHCILKNEGKERSWGPGKGPVARDGDDEKIGRFVYAIFKGPKDFALVRLRKDVSAKARMCHFGGPTGTNDDRGPLLVRLQYYGNGVFVSSVSAGRSAWASGMPNPNHVFATGVASFGDSGAGVTSADGRAVGVLATGGVHLGGVGTGGVDAGTVGITRITPQLQRAEKVLGIDLKLRTAAPL
ncbi:MAG: trypsin-like peptidase domain-containing protein [Actinomycetota bacterium]